MGTEVMRALEAVAARFAPAAHDTILYENRDKHCFEIELMQRALSPDAAALDLGGGVGVNLLVLRQLGHRGRLVLVDRLIEYDAGNRMGSADAARAILVEYHIELREHDFWPSYDSGFADDSFDLVATFETIEHLPGHPRRQLIELARILRRGGAALVSVPNAASLMKRLKLLAGVQPYAPYPEWKSDHFFGHYREYTAPECTDLVESAGLQVTKTVMSAAVPRSRARHAYHDRHHHRLSPHAVALWLDYLAETIVPSLRHSIYVVAHKR